MAGGQYEQVLARLREAARILNLEPGIFEILAEPERTLEVALPIKMDEGASRYLLDTGASTPPYAVPQKVEFVMPWTYAWTK